MGHTQPFRDLFLCVFDPFRNQLVGKIDVDIVMKVDVHRREPVRRCRADLPHAWDAHHRNFNGARYELFDLFSGHTLDLGEYLDQVGAYVGEGINWYSRNGKHACNADRHKKQHNH